MFDAHCHLHFIDSPSTQTAWLEQRRAHGVEGLVLADYDDTQRQGLLQLVHTHRDVHGCLGLHPWAIQSLDDESLDEQLTRLTQAVTTHREHLVAIGETGLDFHVTTKHDMPEAFEARQRHALEVQCELARKHRLPVVLHQVRAAQPLYHHMKSFASLSFMLHAFEGHPQEARQFLQLRHRDRRVLCSFGPAITWTRGQKARQALQWIVENAPSCWTLETDAPDRPPEGLAEEGDALWLPRIVQVAAHLLKISEADVANIARDNAHAFFNL